jgi:YidC/Oxa1 family membrane protein insertase
MWEAIIVTPFINVLLFIYTLVHNFGLAIILFTILIRLITHPLTVQQFKGTQAMQALQTDPRWIEAQKKYKDDREKLAQEQMKLYKELGINPFGSCLPTLIQFPIIIALYQSIIQTLASTPRELLSLTQHIYSTSLLNVSSLIPLNSQFLWMNLGTPERLTIFGIGVPVLAIIVVITTYLQSKLMTPPSTGAGDQGAQMAKAMNLYMPFLMGYIAFTLASGLALYFVASNVFGILQYALIGRLNWRNVLPSSWFAKSSGDAKTAVMDVKARPAAKGTQEKLPASDGRSKGGRANGKPKPALADPKPGEKARTRKERRG